MVRTFELHRIEDETGISGTGIVAEGVIFGDGTCAMRWQTVDRSTATYDDIRALERIHGHNGRTKIVYTGEPFRRGMQDYAQDSCENAPFASVGGLDKRRAMVAPHYITPAERASYIEGYRIAACFHLGEDWETCAFGWSPALTINRATESESEAKNE